MDEQERRHVERIVKDICDALRRRLRWVRWGADSEGNSSLLSGDPRDARGRFLLGAGDVAVGAARQGAVRWWASLLQYVGPP